MIEWWNGERSPVCTGDLWGFGVIKCSWAQTGETKQNDNFATKKPKSLARIFIGKQFLANALTEL